MGRQELVTEPRSELGQVYPLPVSAGDRGLRRPSRCSSTTAQAVSRPQGPSGSKAASSERISDGVDTQPSGPICHGEQASVGGVADVDDPREPGRIAWKPR